MCPTNQECYVGSSFGEVNEGASLELSGKVWDDKSNKAVEVQQFTCLSRLLVCDFPTAALYQRQQRQTTGTEVASRRRVPSFKLYVEFLPDIHPELGPARLEPSTEGLIHPNL